MAKNLTEDAVRDLARDILGLVDSDAARAGVGQLTTFNQLGFAGVADKPDGWYLPKNKADVALVLETKATRIALGKAQVDEVLKNVRIVQTQYEKVIGVLYNGEDVRVFKGEEEVKTPDKLQHVGYYLSLYTVDSIDKERIYQLTARINNTSPDRHRTAGVRALSSGRFPWMTAVNCMSTFGTRTSGASKRSRSFSPPSWRRDCRSCASPRSPAPASSSALSAVRAVIIRVTGARTIRSRTTSWQITTTNASA